MNFDSIINGFHGIQNPLEQTAVSASFLLLGEILTPMTVIAANTGFHIPAIIFEVFRLLAYIGASGTFFSFLRTTFIKTKNKLKDKK
jgi:hypothetical protein